MMRVIKSELIRLLRPSFIVGGIGLMAAFGVLATVIGFSAAGQSGAGPAQYFPSETALAASDGFVSGLALASNLVGIVALAFWAIAVASDYGSGLIRLLVQAEPKRYRLLMGKLGALLVFTIAGTLAATLAAAGTAYVIAPAMDVSRSAWGTDTLVTLLEAFRNLSLSTVVWGIIGFTIATITRSAGVSIALGVGYVVVFENMLLAIAKDAADWLPGATLTALASGGTPTIGFDTAIALGGAYALAGIIISSLIVQRREITY